MHRTVAALLLSASVLVATPHAAQAQALAFLEEGFEDVNTLPTSDWLFINQSEPPTVDPSEPLQGWFQGDAQQLLFGAQAGSTNSYIAVDFFSTAGDTLTGLGTVSNYLITPQLDSSQGGSFSFYTRTFLGAEGNFSLDVLLCSTGCTDPANFTTSLATLSNDQAAGQFYPGALDSTNDWAQFAFDVGPTSSESRIAFLFETPDGGSSSATSPAIGIDTFAYAAIPEPSVGLSSLLLLGLAGDALRRRLRRS